MYFSFDKMYFVMFMCIVIMYLLIIVGTFTRSGHPEERNNLLRKLDCSLIAIFMESVKKRALVILRS